MKSNPPSLRIRLISRTIGADRVVDELHMAFKHSQHMPWILPGISPTNKKVEIIIISIVCMRGGKLFSEHVYWDQASVLVQVGLLDPKAIPAGMKQEGAKRLPVIGREAARRIVSGGGNVGNELIPGWQEDESEDDDDGEESEEEVEEGNEADGEEESADDANEETTDEEDAEEDEKTISVEKRKNEAKNEAKEESTDEEGAEEVEEKASVSKGKNKAKEESTDEEMAGAVKKQAEVADVEDEEGDEEEEEYEEKEEEQKPKKAGTK